ncbi:helix-loop-helix protein delilah [Anopheles maculipalpis]|uniref:helix-loop-helix protein delilah n=1 Tax=Anopheles maculipalpis TaxID=1496333 RepID=UPI002159ABD3|nr:helix-loop-helix protein delilah [Anopheles maculipalpis]
MRHNNIESIRAITFNQQPSMEASLADANNNHNGSSYIGLSMAADGTGSLVSEIKKDEKYSLRQRQSRRTTVETATVSKTTTTTKEKATPKEKPKPKAAPLSKYRRKTANARERSRMREINSAFENLRRAVPVAVAGSSGTSSPVSSPQCSGSAASSEKLTKITTLRLAMKYIRILSDMLHGTAPGTLENNNELDMINHNEIEREVMQKGLLLLEGGYPIGTPGYISSSPAASPVRQTIDTPKASSASSKNNSHQSSTTSSSSSRKRSSSKRSTSSNSRSKKSTSSSSTTSSSRTRASAASNGRKSTTSVPTVEKIDDNIQLTAPSLLPDPARPDPLGMDVDLSSVLESDNDSLILSEPCLSPLTTGVGPGILKSHPNFACTNSQSVVPNDGLEFGLFLESDADSLQLSEPCLSPLSHLDSLNPFNDLLHTGFNEQTALELYL